MTARSLPDRIIDPTKRHDFVLLFDVTEGNPNGDPDAGNLPRFDPETGHGVVTDVAIKRKVRDFVAVTQQDEDGTAPSGYGIFIQSQVALNTLILEAFREDAKVEPPQVSVDDEEVREWLASNQPENFDLEGESVIYGGESLRPNDVQSALLTGIDRDELPAELREKLVRLARAIANAGRGRQRVTRENQAEARDGLCRRYYDIRMFGAVLSTGLNAGQVRGPMQLTFARSVDPIFPLSFSITRQARTTSARMESGPTEMGRKNLVPYGLYRASGFYNPLLARQTHVTADDLRLFWEAIQWAWDLDRSAARGMLSFRGAYIFTHDNVYGNAHAHRLFDLIRVRKQGDVPAPRSFGDYQVDAPREELVEEGVTLTRLV